MADPLSHAELEHARWLATNQPDVSSSIVARLLDALDVERDRHIGVLFDLHKRGVFTLDRKAFGRWLAERRDTPEARFAYVALASLDGPETEALMAARPDLAERVRARSRELATELGKS